MKNYFGAFILKTQRKSELLKMIYYRKQKRKLENQFGVLRRILKEDIIVLKEMKATRQIQMDNRVSYSERTKNCEQTEHAKNKIKIYIGSRQGRANLEPLCRTKR